jgi:uncharacterized repeat protein (TIGR03847 family)
MSESYDLDPVDRITAGAIGEPGQRVFLVQARSGAGQITLVAEKEQVRLLATALLQLLGQLPEAEEGSVPSPVDLELAAPFEPEWRAGEMAIEYDDESDRVAIVIREVAFVDEDAEDDDGEEDEGAVARFVVSRAQARALADHALSVVASGRPRCRLCGQPVVDGESHVCAAMNGHHGMKQED